MNNMLRIFENPEFGEVRVCLMNNEPWFVGRDIAIVLGYEKPQNAVAEHVDEEDRILVPMSDIFDSLPDHMKGSKIVIINESGLYSLILRSNKEEAKKFKKWVTSEVLPAIRKTGHYTIVPTRPSIPKEEMELRTLEAKASLESSKTRQAEMLMEIQKRTPVESMREVAETLAVNVIAGFQAAALPKAKKSFTATEIGDMLGVSANKIGRLANLHNLKTEEYGEWFHDKSRYSDKEVVSFRYFENTIPILESIVKKEKK